LTAGSVAVAHGAIVACALAGDPHQSGDRVQLLLILRHHGNVPPAPS